MSKPFVPDLILYHRDCPDGTCAAMVAQEYAHAHRHRQIGNCDAAHDLDASCKCAVTIPMRYGDPPPNVTGANVVIVDFSFPRDVLTDMYFAAENLIVLDHHKTAQQDLQGIAFCKFDMNRSGARMAYDYFFAPESDECIPWIIRYVEDGDLWRFSLPFSDEIRCYISSIDYNNPGIPQYRRLLNEPIESITRMGESMNRLKRKEVAHMKSLAVLCQFAGYAVPVACAPVHHSDVAGEIGVDWKAPFGVTYFQGSDGRFYYSLRSRSEFDVSTIARLYGGGGHTQAAGFTTQYPVHSPITVKRG